MIDQGPGKHSENVKSLPGGNLFSPINSAVQGDIGVIRRLFKVTSPREIHIKSTVMNVLDAAFLFSKSCKHFISQYYVSRTRKQAAIHLR